MAKRIMLGLGLVVGVGGYTWVAAVRAAPAIRARKKRLRATREGVR